MTNSLFDVIGIWMAFIMVILLLSLIVTSVVQMIQAWFGVRGKNLHFALRQIVTNVLKVSDKKEASEVAAKILDKAPAALLTRGYSKAGLARRIVGPGVSWMAPEDIRAALDALLKAEKIVVPKDDEGSQPAESSETSSGPPESPPQDATESAPATDSANPAPSSKDDDAKKKDDAAKKMVSSEFERRFRELQKPMEKRHARNVRLYSVVASFAVAFLFQVSAPALLARLSSDPEWRAHILAVANSNIDQVESSLVRVRSYEEVSAEALERVEKSFPDAEKTIEEASGLASDRDLLLEELGAVLADHPQKEAILEAYQEELEKLVSESRDRALENAKSAMSSLATFGIGVWQDPKFYYDGGFKSDNLFGVLITALLLSFGAPFWFDRLKDVAKLRDMLGPDPLPKGKSPGSTQTG